VGGRSAEAAPPGISLGKREAPKTFSVSPQTFDRYVGRYRTAAGVEVAITRDGTRFFGQMFGLPPFEIFAASEREFFLTSFDARLTFQVDGTGRATALVLQMGDDQVATRLP
jgi:D-alanyl-D-alanine-carboxypeptidase/D-alanyl-D-alanine-endopeptidase